MATVVTTPAVARPALRWRIYRRRPEIHERLIIVATCTLLIAAVHRFVFFDFVKQPIVHPVYIIGIGASLIMKFGRAWMLDTQAYQSFTRWLAGFYA